MVKEEAVPEDGIIVRAPAKVNLLLAIGPLRPDGFHELLTLFEAVPLEDVLTVVVRAGLGRDLSVRVEAAGRIEGTGRRREPALPKDLDNLAGQAAKLYFEALRARDLTPAGGAFRLSGTTVDIRIEKRIPVAAGLGGGSSNAAAVLRVLHDHFDRPLDAEELLRAARALGSDVPFFLSPGRAVGRSRGDEITPVRPSSKGLPVVLGLPSFALRTPDVYRRFDRMAACGEAPPSPGNEALDGLLDALARDALDDIAAALRNDLQPAAISLRPEIGIILRVLREAGCLNALVSGSGPSVFGLCPQAGETEEIARKAAALLPPDLRGRVVFKPVTSAPGWSGGPEPEVSKEPHEVV